MKNIAAVILFLFTAIATQAQTKWQVDPYHSKVNFSVGHLVISEVDGTFKVFQDQSVQIRKILKEQRSISR